MVFQFLFKAYLKAENQKIIRRVMMLILAPNRGFHLAEVSVFQLTGEHLCTLLTKNLHTRKHLCSLWILTSKTFDETLFNIPDPLTSHHCQGLHTPIPTSPFFHLQVTHFCFILAYIRLPAPVSFQPTICLFIKNIIPNSNLCLK